MSASASTPATRPPGRLAHRITVMAPPEVVYDLVADHAHTPRLSPTVVHIERLEGDSRHDVIQRWVVDGGTPRTWQVARTLDANAGRISFDQLAAAPPVASMHGEWSIRAGADGGTDVELSHAWTLTVGDAEAAEQMVRRMDTGIGKQLRGLKRFAEQLVALTEHEFTQETSVFVPALPLEAVDALWGPAHRPGRLSGSASATVVAEAERCRLVDLRTAPGGPALRRCYVRPVDTVIVWKQTEGLPAYCRSVRGEVRARPAAGGSTVSVRRTDSLVPDALAGLPAAAVAERLAEVRTGAGVDPFAGSHG
ncbi:aromatase/cyclase [Streptomyces sp. NPDC047813]|uniref:aromatase/cyclase n=1 Tax=Streptomyces sp. NPDC047813 TaxID=3154608 RepID=UPI0033C21CDB